MKIALMQPYLFPYIGYFQLINAVDTFCVYDDVNYIKQGWINRNQILVNGRRHLFTLEVKNASSFKPINRTEVGGNREKIIKTVSQAYAKAPYFDEAFPVIRGCLEFKDENLSGYLANSLKAIADYIGIETEFVVSSSVEKNNGLKAQDKVIEICKALNASVYINAIGGMELYAEDDFKKQRIDLFFLRTKEIRYRQFCDEFVPNLSIIDVLMFNPRDEVRRMLGEYEFVRGSGGPGATN